ncbi:hypothetical protein OnM2_041062 [Erysiphe neolycopersici]|uniref:PAC domain-containing protein n=1 Tax=Erysiphe neolycopersici TaxID=212602 RepID=A0A420HVK5_9PEZI|nr:hypothetical protein OnM2_041062 [Erysiphe neolycopersici]
MPVAIEASPESMADSTFSNFNDGEMSPMKKIIESKAMEQHRLDTPPLSESFDTPDASNFFDLKPPPPPTEAHDSRIEDVMKRLYSEEHLYYVLRDQSQFQRFMSFLNRYKPNLVPNLTRYMEMRKAMKAVEYANAVARTIQWPSHSDYYKFSRIDAAQTDVRFEDYATREVHVLISEALPAWITYLLVNVVSDCVIRDITGLSLPIIRELVGTLGEVFCISDPTQKDNPIIYCSEEFFRTTQYGTNLAINRNCRFLQGPDTDKNTTLRISKAIENGQESNELLLNYRRDGTPFVNLLMVSPLYDDKGIVRYYLGAQVDVTGLVLDGLGLDSFRGLLQKYPQPTAPSISRPFSRGLAPPQSRTPTLYNKSNATSKANESLSKLTDLSMMFSPDESEVVTKNARPVTPPLPDNESVMSDACSIRSMLPTNKVPRPIRRIIDSHDSEVSIHNLTLQRNGQAPPRTFPGIYRHYLLVRPYPSLQIIFASPSLRLPGLLRTPLFTKIGGPPSVLSSLEDAFRDGASVTARVLWLPKNGYSANAKARRRWIRCTPLLGSDNSIGVWVIILVPADNEDDRSRPACDSGYHSLGGSEGLGINRFGSGRSSNTDQIFDEHDDFTAIESLVEGRRNSPLDSSGISSRLRRVTILDHDGDSIHKSESSFGVGTNSENGLSTLSRRATEDGIYGQFLANTTNSTTIIEEEA